MGKRSWTDAQLRHAVAECHSWRGVVKVLGLKSTSAIPGVKRHARRLNLDASHFTGPRRWTDEQLIDSLRGSASWEQVARNLGLAQTARTAVRLKGHAMRLGLNWSHLEAQPPAPPPDDRIETKPDLGPLRQAAPNLAATWFTLRGFPVAVPGEDQLYDLVVDVNDQFLRVQVKSTTYVAPNGKWQVGVGHRPYSLDNSAAKRPYDPDSLDYFFIVNGVGEIYVIPMKAIAGRTNIYLDSYSEYKVGDAASLLEPVTTGGS